MMAPNNPTSWHSHPVLIQSPRVSAEFGDLLLMKRSNVIFKMRFMSWVLSQTLLDPSFWGKSYHMCKDHVVMN